MATQAAPKKDRPIWLQEYPAGVPAEIDPEEYSSVADLFEQSCRRHASRIAYHWMGVELSYTDMDRLTGDFASYLLNVLGLRKGDRVAVMMPNCLQYPIAMFGILRAGMVVVNVNPMYTPRELEHQLRDSDAKAIVIMENFCHTLQKVVAKLQLTAVITTELADMAPFPKNKLINLVVRRVKKAVPDWEIAGTISFTNALGKGRGKPFRPPGVSNDDTAFLQYTGGTTGLSKGAQLLHRNIVANVLQTYYWMKPAFRDDTSTEVIITALPLYHIFALTVNCLTFFLFGGKNVLVTDPRDMKGFVKTLKSHRFTALTGVNTLFTGLLNTPGFETVDFSNLRLAAGGGAAVLKATAEKWYAVTKTQLAEGYGLTETSPVVCFTPIDKLAWNGSVGVPLPSTIVSLRDDENNEVALGQPGELCVKGPQVMAGYWNRPEENQRVFTPDGFVRTGDIATMDERGYIRIVDRKKDMILVSGFNVFPNEIENVVAMHPGVLECACIGVPDERSGEAVKVFVVKKDPNLTADELREYCKEQMTGYKVPRFIEFREQLPKSSIGKILRKDLR